MAYVHHSADGDLYNVNFAVGANAPNKRDDVLLVQWLLYRAYTDHPLLAPPGDDLAIDGWIGPETVKWITAFQTDMRRLGRPCAKDGRVDSARKPAGAVSKAPYTIRYLNGAVMSANPDVFANPATDPDMPPELLSALAVNDASAGPFAEAPVAVPSSGGILPALPPNSRGVSWPRPAS
jgi:hypothetical protein